LERESGKSKLMLIAAVTVFGTIGIFRRYIPLSSSVLAMARGFIGMFSLLALVLLSGKKLSKSAIKENFFKLVISGVMIGINWILLFEAYNYTTVAIATLCYYMAPVIVILASPILLKEKLTSKKWICSAIAVFGMVLVSGVFGGTAGGISDIKGVLFGLGAAVFYAGVILTNKTLKNIGAYDKTIVQLAAAALVILPYNIATGSFSGIEITPFVIIMLLIVGVIHTGISYALYFGSMDGLKGQTIALFSYIDPVLAIILSALFLNESMGVAEIVGAVLVLASTLISEMPDKK